MKSTKRVILLATASLAAAFLFSPGFAAPAGTSPISQAYRERGKEAVDFQKVPPVKMFDNLWYVGPGYVSCYLIKTSAGAILIDASEEPDMVAHVIDSIKKTGTDLKDIKYILISHGHLEFLTQFDPEDRVVHWLQDFDRARPAYLVTEYAKENVAVVYRVADVVTEDGRP